MFWSYIKKNLFHKVITAASVMVLFIAVIIFIIPMSQGFVFNDLLSKQNLTEVGITYGKQSSQNVFIIAPFVSISTVEDSGFSYLHKAYVEMDDVEYNATPNSFDITIKKQAKSALRADEIAVSLNYAKNNSISIGDKFFLKNAGSVKQVTVAYIFAPFFGDLSYNSSIEGLVVLGADDSFIKYDSNFGYIQYAKNENIIYDKLSGARELANTGLKDGLFFGGLIVLFFVLVFLFIETYLVVKRNKRRDFVILLENGMPKSQVHFLRFFEILLRILFTTLCVLALISLVSLFFTGFLLTPNYYLYCIFVLTIATIISTAIVSAMAFII